MKTRHLNCLATALFTLAMTTVQADTLPDAPATAERPAATRAQGFDQVLYKGVVGNMLDAVPMDAEQRTHLQRANAVVSGTLSGRSLSILAKLTHPGFLVGGLVWGLWAAANIEAAPSGMTAQRIVTQAADLTDTGATTVAPMPVAQAPAHGITEPRPRVVRIWLSPPAY